MKYYELHENFWQGLVKKGHISWDKESKEEILNRERNKYLENFLEKKNGCSLDLGCGSGSQSFFLEKIGFKCTAVDVSQTAIDVGKKLAEEFDSSIKFLCDDVCHLELNQKFDLITDSCLLYCLVWEKDRYNFFDIARKHLKQDGRFFIYTMIKEKADSYWTDNDYFMLDSDGILWSKGPESFDVTWTEIDGENYFPHRRLYTLKEQMKEIENLGFDICKYEVIHGAEDNPPTFAAWLKLK